MRKLSNVGLKLVRKRLGFNQLEVCSKVGLSQTYLSQIECGQRKPSSDMYDRLCEFYGIPRFVVEWMGISVEDVPSDKQVLYLSMRGVFDKWVDDMFFGK